MGVGAFIKLVVPPEVPGVVAVLIVRGVGQIEPSFCRQLHRVAEKAEVEVGLRIQIHFTEVGARHTKFACGLIVQCLSFLLADLSACEDAVLVVCT